MVRLYLIMLLGISPFFAQAEVAEDPESACFPVSRASHDQHCYFIDNKNECLDKEDAYSCAWGAKRHKEHEDGNFATCEESRCQKEAQEEAIEEEALREAASEERPDPDLE